MPLWASVLRAAAWQAPPLQIMFLHLCDKTRKRKKASLKAVLIIKVTSDKEFKPYA